MKVIIAGSRSITDPREVAQAIRASGFEITEVVSGGARRGVDRIGERWADLWCIPKKTMPANWKALGKAAGIIRNRQMADYAEGLIAVWDGTSRGTADMIKVATSKGLKVFVHKV